MTRFKKPAKSLRQHLDRLEQVKMFSKISSAISISLKATEYSDRSTLHTDPRRESRRLQEEILRKQFQCRLGLSVKLVKTRSYPDLSYQRFRSLKYSVDAFQSTDANSTTKPSSKDRWSFSRALRRFATARVTDQLICRFLSSTTWERNNWWYWKRFSPEFLYSKEAT